MQKKAQDLCATKTASMSFWRTFAKRRWDAIPLCETWETEGGRKRMGGAGSSRNKRAVGIRLHTRWKGKHLKTEQVGLLAIPHNFFVTTHILQVTTYNFFQLFVLLHLSHLFHLFHLFHLPISPFSRFSPFALFSHFSFFSFFSFFLEFFFSHFPVLG